MIAQFDWRIGQQCVWMTADGQSVRVCIIDGPVLVAVPTAQKKRSLTSGDRVPHYWIRDEKSGKKRCVRAAELQP